MPEIVAAFSGTDSGNERADAAAQIRYGSLGGLAQECLEFTERHLNRVEVWRVFGQVAERCAHGLYCLPHTRDLVSAEMVHHDDILASKRWSQPLPDVGQEYFSGHWPVNHQGSRHAIATQGGHESECLPISVRHATNQSSPAPTTASRPHHFGVGRGLVDEHQPARLKRPLLSDPMPPRPGDVRSLLFRRVQGFF
jgi:hypothetical protein